MTNSCSRLPKDYFIPVHPIINLIIIIGLFGFVQLMALQPSYLLHFGTFGKFLHDFTVIYPAQTQLFYRICMFIHCAESSVAFIYASIIHQLNIKSIFKWSLSTFINGMFSLRHLIWLK